MRGCRCLWLPVAVLFGVSVGDTGSWSDFLLFMNSSGAGWFGDGTVMNGPVRSNGTFFLYSTTPGRDNDPWFYSLTSAADSFYTTLSDTFIVISATEPHPEGTNLWVEPYELMCQGPPWFNLGADTLPFGSGNVDWQMTRDAALSSGLFINGLEPGARVIIGADSIHLKETPGGVVQSYCMSGFSEQVAWIDNDPDEHIFLRSMPPDSGPGITVPMTLGCNGSVYIMGDVLYEPVSGGMLGLIVKNGDVVIADTPENDPWNGIWAVETEKEMLFSGSVLMPDGILYAENAWEPHPAVDFTIAGGVQLEDFGITAYISGQNTWGYFLQFDFDSRYFTASPPFYPMYDTGTSVSQGPAISSFQPGFHVLGNPFGEILEVELATPADGPRELLLLDMAGRLIISSTITDRRTLSTDRLLPGTYVLFLESPEGPGESLKVIKL